MPSGHDNSHFNQRTNKSLTTDNKLIKAQYCYKYIQLQISTNTDVMKAGVLSVPWSMVSRTDSLYDWVHVLTGSSVISIVWSSRIAISPLVT